MKKICILFLIMINVLSFASENKLSQIKTMRFYVSEIAYNNGKEMKSEYEVVLKLPDKIKKTVFFPEMNKGEIYLYENGMKTVYLPFFKQFTQQKANADENRIINFFKEIISLDKNDRTFKEKYYSKNLNELKMSTGETIKFKQLELADNFLIPKNIEIQDKGIKIANLSLKEIKINNTFSENEFKLEKNPLGNN